MFAIQMLYWYLNVLFFCFASRVRISRDCARITVRLYEPWRKRRRKSHGLVVGIVFFCFDWLAMSNSCYNPFIYAIYNEKFKKEFKQRFTFGKKPSRFVNDSYEDGQSYRTRILSFPSTNDRSGYSTRKSINIPAGDTLKVPSRNSCHCLGTQGRENGFNFIKTEDIDGHGNSRRYLNLRMSSTDMGKRRLAKKLSNRDDMPIGDERVSELYIFPNSNIVEFTNISYDDKV